jgi:hypothetical protein
MPTEARVDTKDISVDFCGYELDNEERVSEVSGCQLV